MNYKELIGKTVFDFTKDAAIIERITKVNPSDKENVAKYKKDCHPIGKAEGIEELAEFLNNRELCKAAKNCAMNCGQTLIDVQVKPIKKA